MPARRSVLSTRRCGEGGSSIRCRGVVSPATRAFTTPGARSGRTSLSPVRWGLAGRVGWTSNRRPRLQDDGARRARHARPRPRSGPNHGGRASARGAGDIAALPRSLGLHELEAGQAPSPEWRQSSRAQTKAASEAITSFGSGVTGAGGITERWDATSVSLIDPLHTPVSVPGGAER